MKKIIVNVLFFTVTLLFPMSLLLGIIQSIFLIQMLCTSPFGWWDTDILLKASAGGLLSGLIVGISFFVHLWKNKKKFFLYRKQLARYSIFILLLILLVIFECFIMSMLSMATA